MTPEDFYGDEVVLVLQKNKPPTRGKVVGRTKNRVRIWKMEKGMYIREKGDINKKKRFLVYPNELRKIPKKVIEKETQDRFDLIFR